MRYVDEFLDKYGFADGSGEPADAQAVRTACVALLNAIGTRRGSEVKAVEYDRPGVHNSCMIMFADDKGQTDGGPDEAMSDALDELRNLDNELLETAVQVPVAVDTPALERLCAELVKCPVE